MKRYEITIMANKKATIKDTVTGVTVNAKVEPFHRDGEVKAYVNFEDSVTKLQCANKGRVSVPKEAFTSHKFTSNLDGKKGDNELFNKIFGF